MQYFKIGGVDYSQYVDSLTVTKECNYNAQTNAAGGTVVDYINSKRTIEVGIIPLDGATLSSILTAIENFKVSISFLEPKTNALVSNLSCIIPSTEAEYYTIQSTNKTRLNGLTLKFQEL